MFQAVGAVHCQQRFVFSPEEGDADEGVAVPCVHRLHRAAWQQNSVCGFLNKRAYPGPSLLQSFGRTGKSGW